MADPVGVLGTAVGVVSLGIQVGGILKEYIENFRSRGEQISSAQTRVQEFEESLNVIRRQKDVDIESIQGDLNSVDYSEGPNHVDESTSSPGKV
ncbi:hypothetical protein F4809DRAFT_637357 [Biscogniauxia mediterranea]|nr:hypothetical protein F4809DRAFT_637357 [Biscogniauxia mediterranea]